MPDENQNAGWDGARSRPQPIRQMLGYATANPRTVHQKNSADTSLTGAVKVNQPNINNLLILGIGLR